MWLGDIGGLIKFLLVWALIGCIATIGCVIWGLVWLAQHVRFA